MVIYFYPVKKKRKISSSISPDSSSLMLWTVLGLGRDMHVAPPSSSYLHHL